MALSDEEMRSRLPKKMKHLDAEERGWLRERLPDLDRFLSQPSTQTSLDLRVQRAKNFFAGERDDDSAWRHRALFRGNLNDAREALRKSQERHIGPPRAVERDKWTPKPGHEFLTREEAAAILEIAEHELNRNALALGIEFRVNSATGQLEYRAQDVLQHSGHLIQKNKVREAMIRKAR